MSQGRLMLLAALAYLCTKNVQNMKTVASAIPMIWRKTQTSKTKKCGWFRAVRVIPGHRQYSTYNFAL